MNKSGSDNEEKKGNLNSKIILFVDDQMERTPGVITRKVLEKNGATVKTAINAQEAVAILEESYKEIYMVISDLNMGGIIDGKRLNGDYVMEVLASNTQYQNILRIGISGDDLNEVSGDKSVQIFKKHVQVFINKRHIINQINSGFKEVINHINNGGGFISILESGRIVAANGEDASFVVTDIKKQNNSHIAATNSGQVTQLPSIGNLNIKQSKLVGPVELEKSLKLPPILVFEDPIKNTARNFVEEVVKAAADKYKARNFNGKSK